MSRRRVTYGPTTKGSLITSQCCSGVKNISSFSALLAAYLNGSNPISAFVTAYSSHTEWQRGISHYYGGGDGTLVYVQTVFAGELSLCPTIDGISGSSTVCMYRSGLTTDS